MRNDNSVLNNKQFFPIRVINFCELVKTNCSIHNLNGSEKIFSIVTSSNAPIEKGCLFVPHDETDKQIKAIVGEKGITAVLHDHVINDLPCIVVESVPSVLCEIGKCLYSHIALPSLVVVGSTGKTTLKRMIKKVLEKENQVYCKYGNYNTLHALIVTIQEIMPGDTFVIQEVDEKRINNTVHCSKVLKPDIALVTNIAESHIGFYGSKAALVNSFKGISAGMSKNGITVINADDKDSVKAGFDTRLVTVGIYNKDSDYLASNIIYTDKGTEFDIVHNFEKVHIKLSITGEHNVYNAMMAYVVGVLRNVSLNNIIKGLQGFRNFGIRQNVCKIGSVVIYADCYNASLRSLTYALNTFCNLALTTPNSKRVAVIGDIAEIEGFEELTYKAIAKQIDKSNIDIIITFGKDSELIIKNIQRKNIIVKHVVSLQDLNNYLRDLKRQGKNSYLFKASRLMRLERSIKDVFPLHYYKIMFEEKINRYMQ